jgi:hypothetical protein
MPVPSMPERKGDTGYEDPSAEVFVLGQKAKNIASRTIGVYSLVTGKAKGNSALDPMCASHHFLSLPRFRVALGERKNLC